MSGLGHERGKLWGVAGASTPVHSGGSGQSPGPNLDLIIMHTIKMGECLGLEPDAHGVQVGVRRLLHLDIVKQVNGARMFGFAPGIVMACAVQVLRL